MIKPTKIENNSKEHDGFTLLEVLVAIAILSLLSVVAQTTFVKTSDASKKALEKSELNITLRSSFLLMEKDLANFWVDGGSSVEPFVDYSEGFGKHRLCSLLFSTILSRDPYGNIPFTDQARVGYFVMDDPLTSIPTLFRWEKRPDDGSIEEGGTITPLIPNVKSLSFLFFDGESWKESLNEKSPIVNAKNDIKIPLAVFMEITIEDPKTHMNYLYRQIFILPAALSKQESKEQA